MKKTIIFIAIILIMSFPTFAAVSPETYYNMADGITQEHLMPVESGIWGGYGESFSFGWKAFGILLACGLVASVIRHAVHAESVEVTGTSNATLDVGITGEKWDMFMIRSGHMSRKNRIISDSLGFWGKFPTVSLDSEYSGSASSPSLGLPSHDPLASDYSPSSPMYTSETAAPNFWDQKSYIHVPGNAQSAAAMHRLIGQTLSSPPAFNRTYSRNSKVDVWPDDDE